MTEVTVIGAGVVGLCVARQLVDRGATVRVIDSGGEAGEQSCSWWAGGMLAPFCEGESAEEPVVRHGEEALGWWQEKTNAVETGGSLVVSAQRDRADMKQFARRTKNHRTLNRAEIEAMEPELPDGIQQALYFETEANLAPREALSALKTGLERDGVSFETGWADPEALARDGMTIDCRGLAAANAFPDLRGVKGEMLIVHAPDVTLKRTIRLLHPRIPIYVVPREGSEYMIGATMIESKDSNRASVRSVLELLSAAYALNPAFGEAEIVEIGVASRPAFPNNLPRITRNGNLIRVNGLYRHGFLLSPALGGMVADLVFNKNTRPEFLYDYSD
ncbi:FAD-dependent oxidoreductase [Halocynthiibacter sp. C4]|uniref:FAD-dependent oxidoreductase n=1 Tax=Halocynthiibacter sp. C4 TaxID=2992758 RepID=UPI00237C3CC0|nr:FAD-dependent oxidoreductase [Halocynthiibacter sp. C4]MDE0590591.1 FAD-dependent oxidoreductase [Halocynthiibacter sp. C4]